MGAFTQNRSYKVRGGYSPADKASAEPSNRMASSAPGRPITGKLHSDDGMILPIAVLLMAVIVCTILFVVIPGYREHLRNARIETDSTSVATARDVASITYLQDGAQGLVTYYYDELTHKCLPLSELSSIEPYGRTSAEDNKNAITGAKGVPNFGAEGGAQLIAITIQGNSIINLRWTGKKCTVLDYELMTMAERNALTDQQKDEIEADRKKIAENAAGEE